MLYIDIVHSLFTMYDTKTPRYISVRYLAKVTPKDELKTLPFEEAWAKCAGRYPFRVMAIDASRNRNDWGISAERLGSFADKMRGIQLRMDHGDKALDVIGRVDNVQHNPNTHEVYADAWTHEESIARRLHMGSLDAVSMQARAKNVECGSCQAAMEKCKCGDSWKSLVDPEPVEMSTVAEGAYDGARVISGFRAALDKEVKNMSDYDELKAQFEEVKKLVASLHKAEAPLPDTPAPTKTDNTDKKKMGHTPGDDDPTVTDDTNKAEKLAPETKEHMKEDIDEMKQIKAALASLQAKCAELEKLNKEEEKEEKSKKASMETSASYQSRRSQPGAQETFTAQRNDGMTTQMTFKAYLKATEEGKAPFEGVPRAKSPYTQMVAKLMEQGWDEESANYGADVFSAYNHIAAKTSIEHVYQGGK